MHDFFCDSLSLTNGWKGFMLVVCLSIAARGRAIWVEGNRLFKHHEIRVQISTYVLHARCSSELPCV